VVWDEDYFEKGMSETCQNIQSVSVHENPLVRFRVITESLSVNEQIPGGTGSKNYYENSDSRVTMSERMINTKRIYEKLMFDQEYMSWVDRQTVKTKEKVSGT
jgi:hypothetical protein